MKLLLFLLPTVFAALNVTQRNINMRDRYNNRQFQIIKTNLLHPNCTVVVQTNQMETNVQGANAWQAVRALYSVYFNMTRIWNCDPCEAGDVSTDYSCLCTAYFKSGTNLRWFETFRTTHLTNGTNLYRFLYIWVTDL